MNMILIRRVKHLIENPYGMITKLMLRYCPDRVSDKRYIRYIWDEHMDYPFNLKNPKTFNEKLQWLKLYDRNPLYTKMVDKYESKRYVSGIIGEQYIIPTLGIWKHFDDIDFETLPNQFVLKCTHDSGSIAICEDKSTFDYDSAKELLERGLKNNFYKMGREWPYKNVPRRIIAEQYMKDGEKNSLTDYKFYCFNGEPKFLYVSYGLANHSTAYINYVTLDWRQAPFHRPDFLEMDDLPPRPANFELMVELSRKLSQGIPFLRVDFYEISKKVYYSELTFFPGSGLTPFEPQEWDLKIGGWLKLPKKK